MKTLNILSFSLILILHISIDLRSQEIPDHRAENYIPQERNISQFPLNLNSNTSNTWEQLHPTIPRVDYWGVYFIDTVTGFAVGDGGALIKTIDGGLTWRTIESGVTTLLRTIGSYDGSVIVAAGDLGKIIISTDVGETWTELQSVVPHNLWNIQFVTEQTGWLVGVGSSALKTTDGGYTWVNQQTPLNGHTYWDVSFFDNLFGNICTQFGYILRTTDGGISWDVQQPVDNISLFTIKIVTPLRAVAMGQFGKKIITTNGGLSWDLIDYFGGDEFFKIAFIDTTVGYAVGLVESYKTTDGGYSWNIQSGMIDGRNITFIDTHTGFLVSRAMILQKTTDSGITWHSSVIKDNFIDVFFTSDDNGWFIGRGAWDYTSLFQTNDRGKTLTWRNDFPGPRPSSVYFLDSLTGIIGAENKIFKTIDGGATWIEKPVKNLPGNGGVYDRIFFIDDNTGWIKNTYLVKTTDGGESWNFQIHAGILSFHFYDPLNGWAVRGNAKPLKTSDGGKTWIEQVNISLGTTRDVFFIDNLIGIIASSNNLHQTSNGGLTWTVISDIVGFGYRLSNMLNNNIYVIGSNVVYKTSNTGQNWNEVIELRNKDMHYARQFQHPDKFDMAVGSMGLIMCFNDSIIVGIEEPTIINRPEEFYLGQNFPNPFNPQTLIRLDVTKNQHAKLKIYNSIGQHVSTLVDRTLGPGKYEFLWDGMGFTSGIYFYTLEIDNKIQTRKMILLR